MDILLYHMLVMISLYGMCRCQEKRSNYKYILLWNAPDAMPSSFFMSGNSAFEDCPVYKCYVTVNQQYFYGSLRKFDAIIFNGKSLPKNLSLNRFDHQKYIFASMEPASENPICDPTYDGFFNWTATYRLSSDFIFPFILIKNEKDQIVGPKHNMSWPKAMPEIRQNFPKVLRGKKKLAAWFVANCTNRDRNEFVKNLQAALQNYNLSIDIFGRCGEHKCSKSTCVEILERDYFFYLALESAQSPDYVTEKIIPALQNYVVPVVYGGAGYSRFLPPDSYLNGKQINVEKLAHTMKHLMDCPEIYEKYFKWRQNYRFVSSTQGDSVYKGESVCQICEALHKENENPTKTVVTNFRSWWNPNFEQKCSKSKSGLRMRPPRVHLLKKFQNSQFPSNKHV